MRVHLLFPDRDAPRTGALPPGAGDLIADLDLAPILAAMVPGKQLDKLCPAVLLNPLTDPEPIRWRQAVLADVLADPSGMRQLFDLAGRALESQRGSWLWSGRTADSALARAVHGLAELLPLLSELAGLAAAQLGVVRSPGLRQLYQRLVDDLDADYLHRVRTLLGQLRLPSGVTARAHIAADGMLGGFEVLAPPEGRRSWWAVLGFAPPGRLHFTLADRDESGARALGELRNDALHEVAAIAARANGHVMGFFQQLQWEAGFYVGCRQLYDRLRTAEVTVCWPDPRPLPAPAHPSSPLPQGVPEPPNTGQKPHLGDGEPSPTPPQASSPSPLPQAVTETPNTEQNPHPGDGEPSPTRSQASSPSPLPQAVTETPNTEQRPHLGDGEPSPTPSQASPPSPLPQAVAETPNTGQRPHLAGEEEGSARPGLAQGWGGGELETTGLVPLNLAVRAGIPPVGNDLSGPLSLAVITGANQGGKTTFLRSIGLAQLLLQAGLFVPASSFRAGLAGAVHTHFRRAEDEELRSGKLDEELTRMSEIVDRVRPGDLVLMNESFAATDEVEGSWIAADIIDALLAHGVRVILVTHFHALAQHYRPRPGTVFLRAERLPDGDRSHRLVPGAPNPTSHGMDLYDQLFN